MSFLIISPNRNPQKWVNAIKNVAPEIDVKIWPDHGNPDEIDFILAWNHPHGELLRFKNLQCVASMGAGVDHILSDPQLPGNVTVTKVVDTLLTESMCDYVLMAVLNHYRHFMVYQQHRQKKQWLFERLANKSNFKIGIMGLGEMGNAVAQKLLSLNFKVSGWRRTAKPVAGVQCFYGSSQLGSFLNEANILICLLPLTAETRNILNSATFQQMPKGAYLINVARGEHLVEEDLVQALDSGQLAGACLDVFHDEPLPPNHPFWQHPKIVMTPHIASVTNIKSVVPQIVDNYRRLQTSKKLLHTVDLNQGY